MKWFGFLKRKQESTTPSIAHFQDKDASAETFWRWFQQNARAISIEMRSKSGSKAHPELLMNVIHNALRRIDDGLVFEMGTAPDEIDELIISADGIRRKFPAVTSLVSAAPTIDGWRILPFRQRHEGAELAIGGVQLSAEKVFYLSEVESERIDISIILPNLGDIDGDTQAKVAFLLLDMVLGEYDVETSIGGVDVAMIGDDSIPNGRPLVELAKEVDDFQRTRTIN